MQLPVSAAADGLGQRYGAVRGFTERLCAPLSAEDATAQSMPDCSPAKWHLAHTTWFFETFVLKAFDTAHNDVNPAYAFLFNSYYNAAGPQAPRPQRGLMTRPSLAETYAYRRQVDAAMQALLDRRAGDPQLATVVTLGLHHEQQHQELILTDIKHLLSLNPTHPVYRADLRQGSDGAVARPLGWCEYGGGLVELGHAGPGFHYDNEGPRHKHYLEPFALADRLVTNAEYLAFIADGGYARPELWLSAGWYAVQQQGWGAPLYWQNDGGAWQRFTLGGLRTLEAGAPVCHVSLFEADAYARWAGARLATEFEWEHAAEGVEIAGNFVEGDALEPLVLGSASNVGARRASPENGTEDPEGLRGSPASQRDSGEARLAPTTIGPAQMYGDVWEWTRSQYEPYPGYEPAEGALGEYNGKFMCNQFVLRGGSCATSISHIRPTYRNFFDPAARWQFSGIRLARDLRR